MKNTALLLSFALFLSILFIQPAQAQLRVPYNKGSQAPENRGSFNVTPSINPAAMAGILLGPGINLISHSYIGTDSSMGTFADSSQTFGIDSGIVLCTGSILDIPGPNSSTSTSTALNLPGDTDLAVLMPGFNLYDAVVIELVFQPLTDTLIATEMIFGSEEYPEYANSVFNDVFGFFLEGPGYPNVNVANIPGTSVPICINNVNHLMNTAYYVNNSGGALVEYDAYTVPIPLMVPVQPDSVYRLKIAIADAGDKIYDSGIFLKKHSVVGFARKPSADFSLQINGMNVLLENEGTGGRYFELDLGDGTFFADSSFTQFQHTYADTGTYAIQLLAHNWYQVDTFEYTLHLIPTATHPSPLAAPELSFTVDGRILIREIAEEGMLQVFDLFGRPIHTAHIPRGSREYVLNLSPYPKAHYLLRLVQGSQVHTYKVLN